MLLDAKNNKKFIDFTRIFVIIYSSIFREGWLCIERLWVSWKRGKKTNIENLLSYKGQRQVGKTYSILEFGRTHYENVAYFNFETNPKLNETFEGKYQSRLSDTDFITYRRSDYCKRKNADSIWWSTALRKSIDFTQILLWGRSGFIISLLQAVCLGLLSTELNSLFLSGRSIWKHFILWIWKNLCWLLVRMI